MSAEQDIFNLTPPPQEPAKRDPTDIEGQYAQEREDWLREVRRLAGGMIKVERIAELQVDLYSQRQVAIERQFSLMSLGAQAAAESRVVEARLLEKYQKGHDKLTGKVIEIKLNADMAALHRYIGQVDAQVEYFRETVKSLDHIIYGIRSRIQVEDYRTPVR